MGKWRYSSSHSEPWHWMGSGQFHMPAALPRERRICYPLERSLGRPQNRSGPLENITARVLYGDRTTIHSSCKYPTWRIVLFLICLFQFSTGFEQTRAHHQENQLYQYNIWYVSFFVGDRLVCRSGRNYTYTEWHIPDVVLIQLILLMMSTRLLETCREMK